MRASSSRRYSIHVSPISLANGQSKVKVATTRLLAHAGFCLATLVIVIMGWTSYVASSNEAESARRVSQSQNIRQELVGVEALIERTESAQRGYLLSAVEVFPVERNEAFVELEKAIVSFRNLTLVDSQEQRLRALQSLILARQTSMREDELKRRAGDMQATEINTAADAGRDARRQMLALTKAMKRAELSSLPLHRALATRSRNTELGVRIAATVFGFIALILGYLGFVLQLRARGESKPIPAPTPAKVEFSQERPEIDLREIESPRVFDTHLQAADPTISELDDELVQLGLFGDDAMATKLDLARAYRDMGDPDSARSILEQVTREADASQTDDARTLRK